MSGIGTIDNPLDLATALALASPGATFYLRGGTYTGDFTMARSGLSNAQITFQAYPGERPIIDGSLTFTGDYCTWQGIEFAGSAFTDRSAANGTDKITLGGTGNKIVNCILHDGNQGIAGGGASDTYEIYGCLLFFNGWDSQLGHGAYIQHQGLSGRATVRNNIVFNNFGFGLHIYGSNPLNNFTVDKNICFQAGAIRSSPVRNILHGGTAGGNNPIITNNRTWSAGAGGFTVGWGTGNQIANAQVDDNFVVEGLISFTDCKPAQMAGNSFYGGAGSVQVNDTDASGDGWVQADFPDNIYGLQANHPDAVFVEPNVYEAGRAHIAIYNPSLADSVTVDVSAVLNPGDSYRLRNVQDYFSDIQTGTVAGDGTISVDMQAANRSIASPVGWSAPATTFPNFGAFVLELA